MSQAVQLPAAAPAEPRPLRIERDALAMVFCGVAGVTAWFALFGMGLFINSKPFRDALEVSWDGTKFVMCMLTFTPTNVGALCVVSAFIGGCASRLQVRNVKKHKSRNSHPQAEDDASQPTESEIYRCENPAASALRGFVVFGAYIAGSLIANADPFANTTASLYARAAGVTSLAAFTVGFDPTFVYGLIGLRGRGAKQT